MTRYLFYFIVRVGETRTAVIAPRVVETREKEAMTKKEKEAMTKKFLRRAAVASVALALAAAAMFVSACGIWDAGNGGSGGSGGGTPAEDLSGIADKPESEITKIADFSLGDPQNNNNYNWQKANWQNDPSLFGCRWREQNISFSGGQMHLSLWKEGNEEYSGEYRSYGRYGHGYYSVSMKAMKGDGVISSFFTYTNDPHWDEIDIEFLGDDMTRVQFNYYTKGVGGHEFVYDLGFDASAEFHTYGFEWLENSIVWYVDGKPVHKATEDIPTANAQIMMNLWNIAETGPKDWAGVYSGATGSASYEWVGFDPAE